MRATAEPHDGRLLPGCEGHGSSRVWPKPCARSPWLTVWARSQSSSPSRCSSPIARGVRPSPHVLSRGKTCASTSTVSSPARALQAAAADPAGPAPTTRTSVAWGWSPGDSPPWPQRRRNRRPGVGRRSRAGLLCRTLDAIAGSRALACAKRLAQVIATRGHHVRRPVHRADPGARRRRPGVGPVATPRRGPRPDDRDLGAACADGRRCRCSWDLAAPSSAIDVAWAVPGAGRSGPRSPRWSAPASLLLCLCVAELTDPARPVLRADRVPRHPPSGRRPGRPEPGGGDLRRRAAGDPAPDRVADGRPGRPRPGRADAGHAVRVARAGARPVAGSSTAGRCSSRSSSWWSPRWRPWWRSRAGRRTSAATVAGDDAVRRAAGRRVLLTTAGVTLCSSVAGRPADGLRPAGPRLAGPTGTRSSATALLAVCAPGGLVGAGLLRLGSRGPASSYDTTGRPGPHGDGHPCGWTSTTPPRRYEQLRRQLVGMIAAGDLPGRRPAASLRQLAGDLGLAVGTVARSYRELEAAGLVTSRRGGGTRVAATPAPPDGSGTLRRGGPSTSPIAPRDLGVGLRTRCGRSRDAWSSTRPGPRHQGPDGGRPPVGERLGHLPACDRAVTAHHPWPPSTRRRTRRAGRPPRTPPRGRSGGSMPASRSAVRRRPLALGSLLALGHGLPPQHREGRLGVHLDDAHGDPAPHPGVDLEDLVAQSPRLLAEARAGGRTLHELPLGVRRCGVRLPHQRAEDRRPTAAEQDADETLGRAGTVVGQADGHVDADARPALGPAASTSSPMVGATYAVGGRAAHRTPTQPPRQPSTPSTAGHVMASQGLGGETHRDARPPRRGRPGPGRRTDSCELSSGTNRSRSRPARRPGRCRCRTRSRRSRSR